MHSERERGHQPDPWKTGKQCRQRHWSLYIHICVCVRVFKGPLIYSVHSGIPCQERSKPNTMSWPGKRGNFTPSSIRDGQHEITM